MRHPAFIIGLLVAFGLIPVGLWVAFAATLEPAGLGRSVGKALLVLFAPLPVGGALMIFGAALLLRTRIAGRIVATVGAGIVALGGFVIGGGWVKRFAECGPVGACGDELVGAGATLLYAVVHLGVIALVWRARRTRQEN